MSTKYWNIIAKAKWKSDHDYYRIAKMWAKTLDADERNGLEKFIEYKYDALYEKFEPYWLGKNGFNGGDGISLGDDSWSDLLHDVVGRGMVFYNKILEGKPEKSAKILLDMANKNDYEESFSYCTQWDDYLKKGGRISVGNKVKVKDTGKTMRVTDISKNEKGYIEFSGKQGSYLKGDLDKMAKGGHLGEDEKPFIIRDGGLYIVLYANETKSKEFKSKDAANKFLKDLSKNKVKPDKLNLKMAKGGTANSLKQRIADIDKEISDLWGNKSSDADIKRKKLIESRRELARKLHPLEKGARTRLVNKLNKLKDEQGYYPLPTKLKMGKDKMAKGGTAKPKPKKDKKVKPKEPKIIRGFVDDEPYEYGTGGMASGWNYSIGGL